MSTIGGISGMGAAMMPQAMSGASMRMPPQQKMSNLFQMIDTAGTGSITKDQFAQAFNSTKAPDAFKALGLDAAFAKLNPSGSGKVSKEDFIAGMKSMMTFRHQRDSALTDGAQTMTPQTSAQSTAVLNALGSAIGTNVNTQA